MHRLTHTQVVEQGLLQIRLFQQAVAMVHGLVRIAETEHVAGDHQVALGQGLPQVMPVPTGRGKTVDQQQRLALPRYPVADGTAMKVEILATLAPGSKRDLGDWHQVLYPGF